MIGGREQRVSFWQESRERVCVHMCMFICVYEGERVGRETEFALTLECYTLRNV